MGTFLIRVIINAVAIAITAQLLPGIEVVDNSIGTLLIIGLIFGLVNAIIKPILVFLTCPAVILTLGLFILVINGLMLQITSLLVGHLFRVENFGQAFLGGIIMAIVSIIMEILLGVRDNRGGGRRDDDRVIEYRRLR
jgi:putative membrane protein